MILFIPVTNTRGRSVNESRKKLVDHRERVFFFFLKMRAFCVDGNISMLKICCGDDEGRRVSVGRKEFRIKRKYKNKKYISCKNNRNNVLVLEC